MMNSVSDLDMFALFPKNLINNSPIDALYFPSADASLLPLNCTPNNSLPSHSGSDNSGSEYEPLSPISPASSDSPSSPPPIDANALAQLQAMGLARADPNFGKPKPEVAGLDVDALDASTSNLGISRGTIQELLQEQDLKKKRLARKAELARQSRRNKKARMYELEHEVTKLKAEIEQLKSENDVLAQNSTGQPGSKRRKKTRAPVTHVKDELTVEKSLATLVKADVPHEKDVKITQLVSDLGASIKTQVTTLKTCMRSLEKDLQPCLPLQFLDWALTQRHAQFYEDGTGLFLSLFRDEMGASSEQLKQVLELKNQKQKDKNDKVKDAALLEAFRNLEKLLRDVGRLNQAETFERLREIFTPKQIAVYCKWVQQYGSVCVKINV